MLYFLLDSNTSRLVTTFSQNLQQKINKLFQIYYKYLFAKYISPDKLNAEVLATPPFSLCWISSIEPSKCKGVYISTPSLH